MEDCKDAKLVILNALNHLSPKDMEALEEVIKAHLLQEKQIP